MSSAPLTALAQNSPSGNQTQNSTAQDWNAPPEGTEQAQAYRDGIEAAKLDKAAKRPIDATKSHLYVHPPVKGNARDGYRASFTKGYQAAIQHDTAS
jgi:hypothetical protein